MNDRNFDDPQIEQRKLDHLRLCAEDEVEYRTKTTLLEDVELLHDSLPELSVSEVDLTVKVFQKTLSAPLLITGMTGGAEQAREINRTLASVAQEMNIAFGVGSQRAILKDPALADTYKVRDIAPDILLLGNIGAVQAAAMTTAQAEDLVGGIGADALCVHLNPGQELMQPEGDRDFRGCLDGISRLVDELSVPVIAKETGCGLSPRTLQRLAKHGIEWVDTSGAGGTTWIGVEALRTPEEERDLGTLFWEWGVPTAASVVYAQRAGMRTIASGGLRSGLDAAKAIALGAELAGMALPWLKAAFGGGEDAALQTGQRLVNALRTACVLTGSKDLQELKNAPRVIGARLERWTAV